MSSAKNDSVLRTPNLGASYFFLLPDCSAQDFHYCLITLVRLDILVFFLTLEEKLSVFHH